ncbi:MAG TPA: GrpB family protein [Candidatus Angelobacter sp.]|nr:GrpB family protein [Candidatus Angelobacter sp.]
MSGDDSPHHLKPMTEEQIKRNAVGLTPKQLSGKLVLVDYDPAWPRLFARESERINSALGRKALAIEHVGSTSVPGLAAKPIIDILLVVANSADESSYAPALEAAGYVLGIREPEWHEHRMFKGPDTNINLHVFSQGDDEIERMLVFRYWLRESSIDRDFYLATKRELAQQSWKYVQNYADAKSKVVESIIARARTSR